MSSFDELTNAPFPRDEWIDLLRRLVSETKDYLMNQPPTHIPQEAKAAAHVLHDLAPYTVENGGPLRVREIAYVPNRSNVIIEYPAATVADAPTCAFVGSHFDVVHADPAQWNRDPFVLEVDGDMLYGRGTTDCLGHVALQTQLFITLAKLKPQLPISVIGVLIADEEAGGSDACVGVEGLMKHGELAAIKRGPVYWLDCADMQPNIGSGGVVQFRLSISGKMCHSGFPNKGINAIEMGTDVMRALQKRFYADFGPHPKQAEYGFPCSSSFKPTQIRCAAGSLNQIPGSCTIEGDIRLVPFYKCKTVMAAVERYVAELDLSAFDSVGPDSRYTIDGAADEAKEAVAGTVKLEWLSEGMDGLACDLQSDGFKVLADATKKYVGHVKPLADTGSLPLVADLQADGLDVQTVGYGVEDAYHANNEFARISDFEIGFRVLTSIVTSLAQKASAK